MPWDVHVVFFHFPPLSLEIGLFSALGPLPVCITLMSSKCWYLLHWCLSCWLKSKHHHDQLKFPLEFFQTPAPTLWSTCLVVNCWSLAPERQKDAARFLENPPDYCLSISHGSKAWQNVALGPWMAPHFQLKGVARITWKPHVAADIAQIGRLRNFRKLCDVSRRQKSVDTFSYRPSNAKAGRSSECSKALWEQCLGTRPSDWDSVPISGASLKSSPEGFRFHERSILYQHRKAILVITSIYICI